MNDPPIFIRLDDAEMRAVTNRHRQAANGDIGVALPMGLDHVAVIHFVDMIAGENHDEVGLLTLNTSMYSPNGRLRKFQPR